MKMKQPKAFYYSKLVTQPVQITIPRRNGTLDIITPSMLELLIMVLRYGLSQIARNAR